jgi:hypothetical protein
MKKAEEVLAGAEYFDCERLARLINFQMKVN